ncbi:MAG: glycosidase [Candidatus Thiodiazotropha sp. (ex Lucina pensylvanica)]|nr:glycosidase [Candidatus Thiodiazotropha sp. (ex Lucina pensylvanica)]PUB79098.1 MAG: glycosidase [gamma proteobacterium symbiont of Ctena orbiculata]
MSDGQNAKQQPLPRGVMLNAYPDSIGSRLADTISLLQRAELKETFSQFYILPTFFNSDLDRGFSIIDYDLNDELVSEEDLQALNRLNISFKFDLILNHLSVASPQFKDLLKHGDKSEFRHFFIDWNAFWHTHGEMGDEGYVVPKQEHLDKLFMRKPGLPILKVGFPDGSQRPYWNTFYQQVSYKPVSAADFTGIQGLAQEHTASVAAIVNKNLDEEREAREMDLDGYAHYRSEILTVVEGKRRYLGQMDLNVKSELVWQFYEETLRKLKAYGAKIIRLDAFAYLHKEPGESNFFNCPGTWKYLERLKQIAKRYDLTIFPEIHSEYGAGLHQEVAEKGYPIYDFFFPGLVIDALEQASNRHLLNWIEEIQEKQLQTINMLGCHDGIPLLDLRGSRVNGVSREGLLDDDRIQALIDRIIERGGRVKNLYGSDGKKIAYYQVNATFFSALGEDEGKLRLARAIQLFMPGIPQVWYLDLFAGKNDYQAADQGGPGGHKEINRTNLSLDAVEAGLKRTIVKDQLELIRLRNRSSAFSGELAIEPTDSHLLLLTWRNGEAYARLEADLRSCRFSIEHRDHSGGVTQLTY